MPNVVELPLLMHRNRNRNRQRTSQNPSSPLRNGGQFDVPTVEGQNGMETSTTFDASCPQSYNTIISAPPLLIKFIVPSSSEDNNTGQMTVIGQGENSQVQSSGKTLSLNTSPASLTIVPFCVQWVWRHNLNLYPPSHNLGKFFHTHPTQRYESNLPQPHLAINTPELRTRCRQPRLTG